MGGEQLLPLLHYFQVAADIRGTPTVPVPDLLKTGGGQWEWLLLPSNTIHPVVFAVRAYQGGASVKFNRQSGNTGIRFLTPLISKKPPTNQDIVELAGYCI